MEKYDAWVVLRLDGPAVKNADHVAVKGVYESLQDAENALERITPTPNSEYRILRSRRFAERAALPTPKHEESRMQGLDVSAHALATLDDLFSSIVPLKQALSGSPEVVIQRALRPALSQLCERYVANVLGGKMTDSASAPFDITLDNGTTVEVKTAYLSPDARKSPAVMVSSEFQFDFLALWVFRADYSLHAARLIPSSVLRAIGGKPTAANRDRQISLRVTESLLRHPGAKDLPIIE